MAKQNQKKQTRKNRNLPLILAAALVVLLAAGISLLNRPKPAAVEGSGALVIPLSGITEEASFYPVTVDGTEMEVLAIRTADGDVRTASTPASPATPPGTAIMWPRERSSSVKTAASTLPPRRWGWKPAAAAIPGPSPRRAGRRRGRISRSPMRRWWAPRTSSPAGARDKKQNPNGSFRRLGSLFIPP